MINSVDEAFELLLQKDDDHEIKNFLLSLDDLVLKGIFLSRDGNGKKYDKDDHVLFTDSLPDEIQDLLDNFDNLYDFIKETSYEIASKILLLILKSENFMGVTNSDVTDVVEQFCDNPMESIKSPEALAKTVVVLKEILTKKEFLKRLEFHTIFQTLSSMLISFLDRNDEDMDNVLNFADAVITYVVMLVEYVSFMHLDELTDKEKKKFDDVCSSLTSIIKSLSSIADTNHMKDFNVKEFCSTYHLNNPYSMHEHDLGLIEKQINTNIRLVTQFRDALVDGDVDAIAKIFSLATEKMEEHIKEREEKEEEYKEKPKPKEKESVRSRLKRQ